MTVISNGELKENRNDLMLTIIAYAIFSGNLKQITHCLRAFVCKILPDIIQNISLIELNKYWASQVLVECVLLTWSIWNIEWLFTNENMWNGKASCWWEINMLFTAVNLIFWPITHHHLKNWDYSTKYFFLSIMMEPFRVIKCRRDYHAMGRVRTHLHLHCLKFQILDALQGILRRFGILFIKVKTTEESDQNFVNFNIII